MFSELFYKAANLPDWYAARYTVHDTDALDEEEVARLERDKDGTLDKRELRGRLSERDIAAGDPDKDKTIDKAEYLAIVEARFKAANGDKDKTIECDELRSRAGRALLRLLR